MNDIEQKRIELKKVYPGPKWAKKVDEMPDGQVLAVFNRLRGQGLIKI